MPNAITTSAVTLQSGLGKHSANKPLCRCLSWLYGSFPEIKQIALDGSTLERFSAAKQRADGIAGIKTYIYISEGGRIARSKFANNVLAAFDDGPLFVDKPIEKGAIEFIWHGSKDNVEKNVANGKLQQIDYGKSVADKLSSGGSSDASRYPIAYYSFNGSLDDLKKILKKVKSFDGKANIKEALSNDDRIVAKCILDLTVKGTREGTNKVSEITDAGALLDMFKNPLKIKSIEKYGKPYDFIEAIKDRKTVLKAIRNAIDNDKKAASLDKSVYGVLFNSILSKEGTAFSMGSLKGSSVGDMTFVEALNEQKTYGAVISELLIPFLLLCGYKTIDGKEILKGLPKSDEVVSVEFPQNKNNVLTDYDVGFANASLVKTSSGKQYAVSAKWSDKHNSSGLFTLFYDNMKMFGDKVLDQYVKKAGKKSAFTVVAKIVEEDGSRKAMPGKMLTLASNETAIKDRFLNKLASGVDYEDMKDNAYAPGTKYSAADRKLIFRKIDDNIGDLLKRAKDKQLQQLTDLFPYSVQVICDKKLAAILNEDKDFLLMMYDFVYGFYGADIEFQQIQLNEDLSLKYFKKEPNVTKKNVSEYIGIESVSSIGKTIDMEKPNSAISIAQPLRVALLK